MVKIKRNSKRQLEEFFNFQIATLRDRGTPEQIVEIFQNQKGAVLNKVRKVTFRNGNIPFIPVIPRTFRGPYDLIVMVKNGEKAGCVQLNPTAISDVVDAPQAPYYIYDVENGNVTRGQSPKDARKIFKRQKRSPLTAAEVMALATHTNVLLRHYVWAPGSRYGSADMIPDIGLLDGSGRPGLAWDYVRDSFNYWGSPSCGSRG